MFAHRGQTGPTEKIETALTAALRSARRGFTAVIVFSFFINVLGLAGPIYMMQIYDRVLGSRNLSTLAVLTLLIAFLYAVSAILEWLRASLLVRAGLGFDREVAGPVFNAVHRACLRRPSSAHTQALRDVDTVRDYLSSGLIVLCDLPWVPIYILVATALSPWYGAIAVVSCLLSGALAFVNDRWTRGLFDEATHAGMSAANQAITTFRNAEVLRPMGMLGNLRAQWGQRRDTALASQAAAMDRRGLLLAASHYNRLLTQSLILGLGAYLAIQREISPGVIIAGSIIVGRCTQPIEMAIGNWKALLGARSAFRRVQDMLRAVPDEAPAIRLPDPKGALQMENVFAHAPGTDVPVLRGISFALPAGKVLGIIGPSAAGKSSLARLIVGAWQPTAGTVRLDGSDLRHWDPDQLGPRLGYLPQDVELFHGTIADNIGRFGVRDDAKVVQAAQIAGTHELIQRLPRGYATDIGEAGASLSGGQRQRIALARALYDLPALVVLDEPNAGLDAAGEQALIRAVQELSRAGRTVVLITHVASMLSLCDVVLVLNEGVMSGFGPRDEVLAKLRAPRLVAAPATAPPAGRSAGSAAAGEA
ncbi:type I secretion system permease/ATPase [Ancylobacter sp. SL191]|uniref:type I secretion system permease/ATPase n=1 Tax=Ancylobacter sp. SL191 TaxID=2995166 RepID=UPI00226F9C37|nr:type I secretion system permease/ATPase [Ancylobacter sp. SL191]WAC29308.1 type I secretion system permease/ATPase [Ancylobacter sp. SL191]